MLRADPVTGPDLTQLGLDRRARPAPRRGSEARSGTRAAARSGPADGRGIDSRRPSRIPSPSICGSAASSASVYGCSGRSKRSRAEACSTICPAYMTTMSFAVSATTPMSCVMMITPMSWVVRSSWNRSSTPACTVTSSAVVGSSAISSFGLHASAIAIITRCACRVTVRVVVELGRVRDVDLFEQLDRPLPRLLLVHVEVSPERLGDLDPIVSVGFSDVIGSWKIIAMSRPRMSSSSRPLSFVRSCPRRWPSP